MLATALTALLFSQPVPERVTLRVPQDFPTIQSAINAANDGDEVHVEPGTYTGTIDLGSKRIRLSSTHGPSATILDGNLQAPVVRVRSAANRSTVVQGFSIRRGRTTDQFEAGGIVIDSCAAPTIVDNWIYNNSGVRGNAIAANNAAPLIASNWIHDNPNDRPDVVDGGAIFVSGSGCIASISPEISGNLIERNVAGQGGAIYAVFSDQLKITRNRILQNTAATGGAIALVNVNRALIENNLIVGNGEPAGNGGAIYWLISDSERAPYVIGNTLINNIASTGSAIHARGFHTTGRIINNTIVSDRLGSVIHCNDSTREYPPIIRNNNVYAPVGPVLTGECAGLIGVAGNISAPSVTTSDYQLRPGSPEVDAGNRLFTGESQDLSGLPRTLDGDGNGDVQVDMGAFELQDSRFSDGFE